MILTRLAKETDLNSLAAIYCDLYNGSILKEDWSLEKGYNLLHFFYSLQPDIFIIAEEDSNVVGGVASLIKPWFDGNRLIETEIFVERSRQNQGLASRLFMEHFRRAMDLYGVKTIEAHSYQAENGYPLSWYRKQGYTLVDDLYIINGDIQQAYYWLKNRIEENKESKE